MSFPFNDGAQLYFLQVALLLYVKHSRAPHIYTALITRGSIFDTFHTVLAIHMTYDYFACERCRDSTRS